MGDITLFQAFYHLNYGALARELWQKYGWSWQE